jgi:hypothetical protein
VRAAVPRAAGRDRRPGRDQPPGRFGVRKRRDVGHRTGPWTGRVLRLSSWKKLVFQQCVVMPQVRMASFSHEPLKTVRMIRSAKRAVTGGSTPWNPAFLTNCPTTTAKPQEACARQHSKCRSHKYQAFHIIAGLSRIDRLSNGPERRFIIAGAPFPLTTSPVPTAPSAEILSGHRSGLGILPVSGS